MIKSDVPDPGRQFPLPGKMTLSAGIFPIGSNFTEGQEMARQGLDFAKKKKATIARGDMTLQDYIDGVE